MAFTIVFFSFLSSTETNGVKLVLHWLFSLPREKNLVDFSNKFVWEGCKNFKVPYACFCRYEGRWLSILSCIVDMILLTRVERKMTTIQKRPLRLWGSLFIIFFFYFFHIVSGSPTLESPVYFSFGRFSISFSCNPFGRFFWLFLWR